MRFVMGSSAVSVAWSRTRLPLKKRSALWPGRKKVKVVVSMVAESRKMTLW
jgi:hypothetical protein